MARNTDFIGFTFNGRHSSEFNIYSVSDGSRYQDSLVPSPIDYAEQIPGGVGQSYFGSDIDIKEFPLSIAYDKLTEIQIRELRNWLAPDAIGELIFDERPYKTYTAKISASPSLSFICFDRYNKESGKKERVYKGEGFINFVCYYPLGVTSGEKKELKYYTSHADEYANVDEWAVSTGMLEDLSSPIQYNKFDSETGRYGAKLYNPGDKETGFKIIFRKTDSELSEQKFWLENSISTIPNEDSKNSFTISARSTSTEENTKLYGTVSEEEKFVANTAGYIEINTNNNTITFTYIDGDNEQKTIPAYFLLKKGFMFKIPITTTGMMYANTEGISELKIDYDYLYY